MSWCNTHVEVQHQVRVVPVKSRFNSRHAIPARCRKSAFQPALAVRGSLLKLAILCAMSKREGSYAARQVDLLVLLASRWASTSSSWSVQVEPVGLEQVSWTSMVQECIHNVMLIVSGTANTSYARASCSWGSAMKSSE